jgi:hypothetical protein
VATTSKNTDKSPARKNYWSRRHLEDNKVKKMMKAFGLDKKQAKERWLAERKRRTPSLFVKDFTQGEATTHKNKVRVRHTEEELYAFELIGFRSKLRNRLAGNFNER